MSMLKPRKTSSELDADLKQAFVSLARSQSSEQILYISKACGARWERHGLCVESEEGRGGSLLLTTRVNHILISEEQICDY